MWVSLNTIVSILVNTVLPRHRQHHQYQTTTATPQTLPTRATRRTHFVVYCKQTKVRRIGGRRGTFPWLNIVRDKSRRRRGNVCSVKVPSRSRHVSNTPRMKWDDCVMAVILLIYPPLPHVTSNTTIRVVNHAPSRIVRFMM